MAKSKKSSAKSAKVMSKAELAVIERDRIVRRGVLVPVVGTQKAPGSLAEEVQAPAESRD